LVIRVIKYAFISLIKLHMSIVYEVFRVFEAVHTLIKLHLYEVVINLMVDS